MANIELHLIHEGTNENDEIVRNAACVPLVGAQIETELGIKQITNLRFDYHRSNGNLRVWVTVA